MSDEPLTIRRPYREADLPTYEHIHATTLPTIVDPESLHPTQPMLDLARLLAVHRGEPAEGPDPCPHVVAYDGELWVHNGHHRWINALLRGDQFILVRIAATDG